MFNEIFLKCINNPDKYIYCICFLSLLIILLCTSYSYSLGFVSFVMLYLPLITIVSSIKAASFIMKHVSKLP